MVWVKSDFAGELAVISTWLSAFIPWSVSYASPAEFTFLSIRFPFLRLLYIFGVSFGSGERPLLPVWEVPGFESNPALTRAHLIWLAAAGVFALALALSVTMYLAEARIESGPVDPVRLAGGLLGLTALLLSGSMWLLWTNYPGISVPLGVVFLYVFAGVLLTVERT